VIIQTPSQPFWDEQTNETYPQTPQNSTTYANSKSCQGTYTKRLAWFHDSDLQPQKTIPLLQERLLARQVATKKDLSKAIARAKLKFNTSELICKVAIEHHEHSAAVRGAFVVFQRREFQEDVLRTAPQGEHMLFRPCAVCLLQLYRQETGGHAAFDAMNHHHYATHSYA
jgi:hypothetical protein